jgi:hypothetical protein
LLIFAASKRVAFVAALRRWDSGYQRPMHDKLPTDREFSAVAVDRRATGWFALAHLK